MPGEKPESAPQWRIGLVDDDGAVRTALGRVLITAGYDVIAFRSAKEFLRAVDRVRPDILLVDLQMQDIDGLTLQATLIERDLRIPTVFLSGHADAGASVRALRDGAVDVLEKPRDEPALISVLNLVKEIARGERARRATRDELAKRAATLTHREREVFNLVVTGRLNKQIAALLGTTEKTIKVHRGRVMAKMQAKSIPDLVRMFDLIATATVDGPAIASGVVVNERAGELRTVEPHARKADGEHGSFPNGA
jgi:FixJ family two-component response regulator